MHEMFFVWNRSLLGFSIQWVEILESIFLGCTIVQIYWLMKSNTLSNLYVSWDCCLIEATICWSTIWIFIVFLKIWWNEKWKYEGMKTGNMMEWKLEIWRNEKWKYKGMKKEGSNPLIIPSLQISYWIYF